MYSYNIPKIRCHQYRIRWALRYNLKEINFNDISQISHTSILSGDPAPLLRDKALLSGSTNPYGVGIWNRIRAKCSFKMSGSRRSWMPKAWQSTHFFGSLFCHRTWYWCNIYILQFISGSEIISVISFVMKFRSILHCVEINRQYCRLYVFSLAASRTSGVKKLFHSSSAHIPNCDVKAWRLYVCSIIRVILDAIVVFKWARSAVFSAFTLLEDECICNFTCQFDSGYFSASISYIDIIFANIYFGEICKFENIAIWKYCNFQK